MNPWPRDYRTDDTLAELKERSPSCDLCGLFYDSAQKFAVDAQGKVQFLRVGSSFKLSLHGPPVLSIVAGPGPSRIPQYIQRGYPVIPPCGQKTEIRLLREWLKSCDQHKCGRPASAGRVPTRLIDVGDRNVALGVLRLDCAEARASTKYIALSHCWGDPMRHRSFMTTKTNIAQLQQRIDFGQLPRTFQDAVTLTRSLGIRYLWIDSLCIIQQDEEDWNREARRMEDVFSSAYCTLAATSSDGADSGFLKPRPQRRCVKVTQGPNEAPFWVCEAIDNFREDVELSVLNRRGWVFQERALSYRTIYFAKNQVYWECGEGVRCETLSTITNLKSSFFADPDFPRSAFAYYRGMRIRFYEYLYESYSRLSFTRITDRSVGIAGVEVRLARTYETCAKFGLLDKYFHRSLLWMRAEDEPLHCIAYQAGGEIPSWSWMAVRGAITYLDVPFGKVNWNGRLQSPLSARPAPPRTLGRMDTGTNRAGDAEEGEGSDRVIFAEARDFTVPVLGGDRDFILDRPVSADKQRRLKCVVVATEKEQVGDLQHYYVLLVAPTDWRKGCVTYERAGVAILRRRHVAQQEGLAVQIV